MNIPYLLKILDTNKLSELVQNMDMPALDMNLLIFDAEQARQIEVDREKDRVKALVDPEVSFDSDLASKLLRMMQHYEREGTNLTRGRLNSQIKDPTTGAGYPWHDYLMSLQYLIDSGQIVEEVVSVPGIKNKRPARKFVFLCFPDNPNEDWNREVVNKWIASSNQKGVK